MFEGIFCDRSKTGREIILASTVWTGRGRVNHTLGPEESPTFEAQITIAPLDCTSTDTAFFGF